MAVVLGNLALLLDLTSPWNVNLDRKTRSVAQDLVLNLPSKRDPHAYAAANISKSFDSDGETHRNPRVVARAKGNSKVDDVDFDAGSSDDEFDEDDESSTFDWKKEMRRKVTEIEETKELERIAEEVLNRVEEESERDGKEETEEEKRERVRRELIKVAREQAERKETANLMFELGQEAYGRGKYERAVEFLEGALTIIPRASLLGGEIQIWLAMAYEANNRREDCIALYLKLEKTHPYVSIQRQAANLRYISQAPKLKISQEEMVTFPRISSSYDSYASTWSDQFKDKKQRLSGSTTNQLPSSRDYLGDFLDGLGKNKVFWVSLALWLGLVGTALVLQR